MQKIDIAGLTADDMLDLIMDMELDILHANGGIIVGNSLEGSRLTGRSKNGISEAIRSWAKKYNEMVQASYGN